MALKAGDRVQTKVMKNSKKKPRPGVIVKAVVGAKKHTWEVRFDDNPGEIEIKTSKMLMHPPVELAAAPTTPAPEVNNLIASQPTRRTAPQPSVAEVTDVSDMEEGEDEDNDGVPPLLEGCEDDDDDLFSAASVESTSSTAASTDVTSMVSSIAAMFPDFEVQVEVEDTGYIPNESGDSVEEEAIEIEPEDVYQAKHRIYLQEKAALLAEGRTYEKKPSDEGINIGSRVQTKRRRDRQFGRVVGRSDDNKDWMVLWQGAADPVQINFKFLQRSISAEMNIPYIWKIVEDSVPDQDSETVEYGDIGLAEFDFSCFSSERTSKDNPAYDGPYLQLLQKLWHGDWKQQFQQCNARIRAVNAINENKKNWRKMDELSEHEWWVFHGILLSAAAHGRGGHVLWEKTSHRRERTMTTPINYGLGDNGLDIMPE